MNEGSYKIKIDTSEAEASIKRLQEIEKQFMEAQKQYNTQLSEFNKKLLNANEQEAKRVAQETIKAAKEVRDRKIAYEQEVVNLTKQKIEEIRKLRAKETDTKQKDVYTQQINDEVNKVKQAQQNIYNIRQKTASDTFLINQTLHKQLDKLKDDDVNKNKSWWQKIQETTIAGVKPLQATIGGFFSSLGGWIRQTVFKLVGDALESFKELDKGVRQIATLISDTDLSNVGGLSGLRQQAKDLSLAFGKDIPDSIKAMNEAVSSGVDVKNLKGFMDIAGGLSVGGATSLNTSVNVLTSLSNAYGIAAEDTKRLKQVSDTLFIGMNYGKTTIDDLSRNLAKTAPIAKMAGVSIEDLVAATAGLTAEGKSTALALDATKSLIMSIIKPTAESAKTMKALGIEFGDFALKNKTLKEWVDDTGKKLQENGRTWKDVIGNIRGLSSAVSLAGGAGKVYTKMMDDVAKSAANPGKFTERAVGIMAESVEVRLNKVKIAFETSIVSMMEKLLPLFESLIPVIQQLIPMVQSLGNIVASVFSMPIFKDALNIFKDWYQTLASIIAPIETAKTKFDEFYSSVKKNNESLNTLSQIKFTEKDSVGELSQKIEQVRSVAPDLAKKLESIGNSSFDSATKTRLLNNELAKAVGETQKLTSAQKEQALISFNQSVQPLISQFTQLREEYAKLTDKQKNKIISDDELSRLATVKDDLNALVVQFQGKSQQLFELGIDKTQIKEMFDQIKEVKDPFSFEGAADMLNTTLAKSVGLNGMNVEYLKSMNSLFNVAFKTEELKTMEQHKQSVLQEKMKYDLTKQSEINNLILSYQEDQSEEVKTELQNRLKLLETQKKTQETLKATFQALGQNTGQFDVVIAGINDSINKINGALNNVNQVVNPTFAIENIENSYEGMLDFMKLSWEKTQEEINITTEEGYKDGFNAIEDNYKFLLDKIEKDAALSEEAKTDLLLRAEEDRGNKLIQLINAQGVSEKRKKIEQEIADIMKATGSNYVEQKKALESILAREVGIYQIMKEQGKARIIALQQEQKMLEIKLEQLKAAKAQTEETIKQLESDLKYGRTFVDEKTGKFRTVELKDNERKNAENQLKSLQDTNKQINTQIDETSSSLKEVGNSITSINTSIKAQEDVVKSLQDTIKKTDDAISKQEEKKKEDKGTDKESTGTKMGATQFMGTKKDKEDDKDKEKEKASKKALDDFLDTYEKMKDVSTITLSDITEGWKDYSKYLKDLNDEDKKDFEKRYEEIKKNIIKQIQESQSEVSDLITEAEKGGENALKITSETVNKVFSDFDSAYKKFRDPVTGEWTAFFKSLTSDEQKFVEQYLKDMNVAKDTVVKLFREGTEILLKNSQHLIDKYLNPEQFKFDEAINQVESEFEPIIQSIEDRINAINELLKDPTISETVKVELQSELSSLTGQLDTLNTAKRKAKDIAMEETKKDDTTQKESEKVAKLQEEERQSYLSRVSSEQDLALLKLKNAGYDEESRQYQEEELYYIQKKIDYLKSILEKKQAENKIRKTELQNDLNRPDLSEDERTKKREELTKLTDDEVELNKQLEELYGRQNEILKEQQKWIFDILNKLTDALVSLTQAFEDGQLSSQEFMSTLDDLVGGTVESLGTMILGEAGGKIAGALYSVLKGVGQALISWYQSESNNIVEMNKEYATTMEDINKVIENRNKLLEYAKKLHDESLDSAKEQYEYNKKTSDELAKQLNLEGANADELTNRVMNLQETIDLAQSAKESLDQVDWGAWFGADQADDNWFARNEQLLNKLGFTMEGFKAGKYSKDQITEALDSFISGTQTEIGLTEDLINLIGSEPDALKSVLDEQYKLAQLRAEIKDDEIGMYKTQIDFIQEQLNKSDELKLSEYERLELQKQLLDLQQSILDNTQKELEDRTNLAVKVAKLQGKSEEEINEIRLKGIENQIKLKIDEINLYGNSIERQNQLADLELERLDIQKELNGEVENEGILRDKTTRNIIRQLLEAKKIGEDNYKSQLQASVQALQNKGLSNERISEMLGITIDEVNKMIGEQKPTAVQTNMNDLLTDSNVLMEDQNVLIQNILDLLQNQFGVIPETTLEPSTNPIQTIIDQATATTTDELPLSTLPTETIGGGIKIPTGNLTPQNVGNDALISIIRQQSRLLSNIDEGIKTGSLITVKTEVKAPEQYKTSSQIYKESKEISGKVKS